MEELSCRYLIFEILQTPVFLKVRILMWLTIQGMLNTADVLLHKSIQWLLFGYSGMRGILVYFFKKTNNTSTILASIHSL